VGQSEWRRIAGLRVVRSWPTDGYSQPPRKHRHGLGARILSFAGIMLTGFGVIAIVVVLFSQVHAPRPSSSAAGTTGSRGSLELSRSVPVSISIPAIGVDTTLLRLGDSSDGSMAVPDLATSDQLADWYKYSPTPGQLGASVILGHLDGYSRPAVFFRLGALVPGDRIDVGLTDGVTAVFRVTGVRTYLKDSYPASLIYTAHGYAGLRLITCGGDFDYSTGHYLSSVVVFAVLESSHR
jgi:hypothetical protein